MKKIILSLLAILTFSFTNAQKIKVKKDKILIDGKEVLKIDWSGWTLETTIKELDTDKELIFAHKNSNGTPGYSGDDYYDIKFLSLDKEIQTSESSWGKQFVKWLFKNKVFNLDGTLNSEKIDVLIKKYDEDF